MYTLKQKLPERKLSFVPLHRKKNLVANILVASVSNRCVKNAKQYSWCRPKGDDALRLGT